MAQVSKNGTAGLFYSADGTTYTKIPGVTSFTPPTTTTETIDATDYDSPAGYREYISGLKEGDESSFEMHFDETDTTQTALYTAQGGAAVYFKAVLDTKHMIWQALVLKFEVPQEVGGIMKATCTFKLTGAVTYETISE